jgi:hypothetical protein
VNQQAVEKDADVSANCAFPKRSERKDKFHWDVSLLPNAYCLLPDPRGAAK